MGKDCKVLEETNNNERMPIDFQIVDNEKVEIAEMASDEFLLLEGIAFHDGKNKNGAVIFKEDAKKDIHTMVGSPLRVLWRHGKPSGHGYDRQKGIFDKNVQNIGYIHNACIIDEGGGKYKAKVQAVMWKKYYPKIAERLMELHEEDSLRFSIEAERDFEYLADGSKKCFNNKFIGLSMVAEPAWEETRSLMVAEDENKSGTDNKKEKPAKDSDTNSSSDKEKVLELKMENISLKNKIKDLTNDLETHIRVGEEFKQKELGRKRLEKLSKYGEVKDSVEELGKLKEDEYYKKLETIMTAYVEKLEKEQEKKDGGNTDNSTVINTLFDKSKKDKKSNKEILLDALTGLGK